MYNYKPSKAINIPASKVQFLSENEIYNQHNPGINNNFMNPRKTAATKLINTLVGSNGLNKLDIIDDVKFSVKPQEVNGKLLENKVDPYIQNPNQKILNENHNIDKFQQLRNFRDF